MKKIKRKKKKEKIRMERMCSSDKILLLSLYIVSSYQLNYQRITHGKYKLTSDIECGLWNVDCATTNPISSEVHHILFFWSGSYSFSNCCYSSIFLGPFRHDSFLGSRIKPFLFDK